VNSKAGERRFETIDFAMFKGKKFIPVINSLNPALTKAVLAQTLQEILTMLEKVNDPELLAVPNKGEMFRELINSLGIDNPDLLRSPDESQQWMQQNDIKTQLFTQFQQAQQQKQQQAQLVDSAQKSIARKNIKEGLEAQQDLTAPPQIPMLQGGVNGNQQ
jgi:hypothetical protein